MLSDAFAHLLIEKKITVSKLEKLLSKYHLSTLLPSILISLKRLEAKQKEHEVVHVSSPFPLSEKTIESIKKELHAPHAEHAVHINKELVAGYVASYKEKKINKSVRLVLDRFINAK